MADKKITDLTAYTTPIDTDVMPVVDITNTTTKKITWANVKATLKTYFDTLYDWATNTHAATSKTTPVDADELAIVDSAASNVIKKLTWANLKITLFTSIDLGNADTTLSRSAAGQLAVEGVDVLTISNTKTTTNKRSQPRIISASSYTTDTGSSLDVSTADLFVITAQAGALKFNNPGGTPVQGEKLIIRIKDNGTARALTYDTQFRAMGTALPTTTVLSKTLYMGFIYNSTDTKWDLVAAAQEA